MDNQKLTDKHLIIPFASSLDEGCQIAITKLDLPNLSELVLSGDAHHSYQGSEFDFLMPYERMLIDAQNDFSLLVPCHKGYVPRVIITPCHWIVGIDRITMANPESLHLTEVESRALFETVKPYFLSDEIQISYESALVWHVECDFFNEIKFASLDRVIGRHVDAWQPLGSLANKIRRLQNEIQMLFHTHLINVNRETQGLPTVNSFWISHPITHTVSNLDLSLRKPSLAVDWEVWSETWRKVDRNLASVSSVSLYGERGSCTYSKPKSRNLVNKIQRLFKPAPTIQSVLTAL
jgi:hypothetical protein